MANRKVNKVVTDLVKSNPIEYDKYIRGDKSVISYFLGETLKQVKSRNIKRIKEQIVETLNETI